MRYPMHAALTATLAIFPAAAQAQFQIDWYTIDSGGGTSSGGVFTLAGTIGQPDAAASAGGPFQCNGGFWAAFGGTATACYPNCDNSSIPPILTANDFQCFLNAFAASNPYANCDGSSAVPLLTANDFQCFLINFAAGCS